MKFQTRIDRLGMSHAQLAEALDLSERQIRRYVAGAEVPRVVLLAMAAIAFAEGKKKS